MEIGKLLVPGGGFIAIAEKIIRLAQFIVESREKILDLIESFVNSFEMAVKGNVPGIVKLITGALTRFITVALDFLVTFFGLGGLKDKVERFIERMRKPVIRGIDWVLGKFKPIVMKGKEWVKSKAEGAKESAKEKFYGSEKEKQDRLDKGMAAGVAAINKVKGDKVPGTVAKAKLVGLRLRYGLPVLEAVAKDGRWFVHGEIQRAMLPTDKGEANEKGSDLISLGKDNKAGADKEMPLAPDVQKRWDEGLAAIDVLVTQSSAHPLKEKEIVSELSSIKQRYGFKVLKAEPAGAEWIIQAELNPRTTKKAKREDIEIALKEKIDELIDRFTRDTSEVANCHAHSKELADHARKDKKFTVNVLRILPTDKVKGLTTTFTKQDFFYPHITAEPWQYHDVVEVNGYIFDIQAFSRLQGARRTTYLKSMFPEQKHGEHYTVTVLKSEEEGLPPEILK